MTTAMPCRSLLSSGGLGLIAAIAAPVRPSQAGGTDADPIGHLSPQLRTTRHPTVLRVYAPGPTTLDGTCEIPGINRTS